MSIHGATEMNIDSIQDDMHKLLDYIPQLDKVFNLLGKIGEGTFSKVYRATIKTDDSNFSKQEYALKYLVPTSHPLRIANELLCLKELGGTCNIIGVETCLMEKGHVVIVMPNFYHDKFQVLNILLALEPVVSEISNTSLIICDDNSSSIKENSDFYTVKRRKRKRSEDLIKTLKAADKFKELQERKLKLKNKEIEIREKELELKSQNTKLLQQIASA